MSESGLLQRNWPPSAKRKSAWLDKREYSRRLHWLVAAWVVFLATLLSLPQKYRLPAEWDDAVVIAVLWVSLIVVMMTPFWKYLSFWLGLILGLVAQVEVIRAMHPELMTHKRGLAAIGMIVGIGLWGVISGGTQRLRPDKGGQGEESITRR